MADRYVVEQGWAATVELDEGAVLARELRNLELDIRDAARTLMRQPLPRDVAGMTKVTAAIFAVAGRNEEDAPPRRPPSAVAVDRMGLIVECLFGLDIAQRNILFVRGLRFTWEGVIERLGLDCSVSTVKRHHKEALVKMLCEVMQRGTKKA